MPQSYATPGIAVPPLARAVLDALSEGVLVFDGRGRLLHANGPARGVIGEIGPTELRRRLEALGARAAPLREGSDELGEAVFLPSNGASTLAERERHAIEQTLSATNWRLAETSRRLGISRTTLWRRLKAYGLSREDRRSA